MSECVICGNPIPRDRGKKDTCSNECGAKKALAWIQYLEAHKDLLMDLSAR